MQNQSQEMIDKFMHKRKSKHKKRTEQENWNESTKNISRIVVSCLVVSEEIGRDRLTEIIELLRLEHLSYQEKTSITKFIIDSQDRFTSLKRNCQQQIYYNTKYPQQMIDL